MNFEIHETMKLAKAFLQLQALLKSMKILDLPRYAVDLEQVKVYFFEKYFFSIRFESYTGDVTAGLWMIFTYNIIYKLP